jgi:hypothetical protein
LIQAELLLASVFLAKGCAEFPLQSVIAKVCSHQATSPQSHWHLCFAILQQRRNTRICAWLVVSVGWAGEQELSQTDV